MNVALIEVCVFESFSSLVGMSHPNKNIAIIAAQHCLRMYNQGGPGIWHRQSQRFLSPTFQGTSDDPALLPYVLKLAGGEDPSGEAMKPLARWLSRFSTIKLAERSVEGIHARLTSVIKRAPYASLAYMSMELRFEDLLRAVASGTDVACLGLRLESWDFWLRWQFVASL